MKLIHLIMGILAVWVLVTISFISSFSRETPKYEPTPTPPTRVPPEVLDRLKNEVEKKIGRKIFGQSSHHDRTRHPSKESAKWKSKLRKEERSDILDGVDPRALMEHSKNRRKNDSGPSDWKVEHAMKRLHDKPKDEKEEERFHESLQHGHEKVRKHAWQPKDLPSSSLLRVVLVTTLKPCTSEAILNAQHNAIGSWISQPHIDVTVLLLGNDTCSDKLVAMISRWKPDHQVHVDHTAAVSTFGTVFLGDGMQYAYNQFPERDLYGLINADIVMPTTFSHALNTASDFFRDYFIVGHRTTFDLKGKAIDFSSADWEAQLPDASIDADRKDAEDYFIWTYGFFHVSKKLPNFHIGRPAYDNWLVNKAIHTFKPTIDATNIIRAVHQKHDYRHINNDLNKKYWGTELQKANYKLGIDNGGWQHGLIEFVPWEFGPDGCGQLETDDHPKCEIVMKREWKPLSNGEFGDIGFYRQSFAKFITSSAVTVYDHRFGRCKAYHDGPHNS